MIWNAVNDPLFGYIQDNFNWSWVKSRRHSVLYGAPWFSLAFLLTWFPWDPSGELPWLSGLQLMVVLCLYDSFFTFVLLAQCAIFTELSTNPDDRVRLVRYSKIASLIGSSSVFFCEVVSHNMENYGRFQAVCCVLTVLSFLCFFYTGRNAYTKYDISLSKDIDPSMPADPENCPSNKYSDYPMWTQVRQILCQRNFISFVLMNFLTIYLNTFLGNFSKIICDELIQKSYMSSFTRSLFYGSLQIVPDVS